MLGGGGGFPFSEEYWGNWDPYAQFGGLFNQAAGGNESTQQFDTSVQNFDKSVQDFGNTVSGGGGTTDTAAEGDVTDTAESGGGGGTVPAPTGQGETMPTSGEGVPGGEMGGGGGTFAGIEGGFLVARAGGAEVKIPLPAPGPGFGGPGFGGGFYGDIPGMYPGGGPGAGDIEPAHQRYRSGQDNQLGIIDNSGEVIPIEAITECPTEERERRRRGRGDDEDDEDGRGGRDGRDWGGHDRDGRGRSGTRTINIRGQTFTIDLSGDVGTQVQTIIAAVRAGIADTPFSIKNDVYLDGDKIGEHMNKHLFGNFGAVK
jgi:hypothetical protein